MAANKNFVVKNGLEVGDNLIFADDFNNRVGIATTNPKYTLDVVGGIGATHLNVSGVSTFSNLVINGRLSAGSSLGQPGQYLVSTGTGVTWKTNINEKTTTTFVASVGQTIIQTPYTPNLVDVFINGVKLSSNEYTANNGTDIILDDPCFGNETIEVISINSDENYFGGYLSIGSTIPINVSYSNNRLVFTVSGIGSTSFALF